MEKYHKIETVYKRDDGTKKLIEGEFRSETVEFLKDNTWLFTEKIDGTNVRVCWDGHSVNFAGRTDNAQFHPTLSKRLNDLFCGEDTEQLFEQKFGEKEVILFGEGYGPKIQNGGNYRDDVDFILFDVKVGGTFLEHENVVSIAKSFGIEYAPVLVSGTIEDGVDYVKNHEQSEVAQNGHELEGLVGRPVYELRDKRGKRLVVKIKKRDFK